MARKEARQRINYVLPLANSPGGHRLGINGLAVDIRQSILYTGGRDGVICAWDLNFDLGSEFPADSKSVPKPKPASIFRHQTQAHTHWVNDLLLVQDNSALVSASSDLTVRVWRPKSDGQDEMPSATLGLHSDYVKCLASPSTSADWVASGGLDHKICVWDINRGGEILQIDTAKDDADIKGSIYALSTRRSIMASGGPESVVKLWDPRNGKRINVFVGHTDNIRDILISESGDMILTASSDQTVKVWSVTAGRCMHTLTMHNDSVWALYSNHPDLKVFYSSDRSGLVAKTDFRGVAEVDEGVSIALFQEHEGIHNIVAEGGYVWTASSSSSINRWRDVDTRAEIDVPASPSSTPPDAVSAVDDTCTTRKLPYNCLLRLSSAAPFPFSQTRNAEAAVVSSGESVQVPSEILLDAELGEVIPHESRPVETIEGQHGLIKHTLLNDKRRVLTLDTAGEVTMWDLLTCRAVQKFGKRHLEDVMTEVNTMESVNTWCAVNTRTGRLSCVLEANNCFDAEVYADELTFDEPLTFREDQRINLGKWVLRYLFSNLIDEEIKRDADHRKLLFAKAMPAVERNDGLFRKNAPGSIQLPMPNMSAAGPVSSSTGTTTPRPGNGVWNYIGTPGLSINQATPAPNLSTPRTTTMAEEPAAPDKRSSHHTQNSESDYFSSKPHDGVGGTAASADGDHLQTASATPGAAHADTATNGNASTVPEKETKEKDGKKDKDRKKDNKKEKEGGSRFTKTFRMTFPKKKPRPSTDEKVAATAVVDEKAEESDKASSKDDKVVEDNFFGTVQKMRYEYDEKLQALDGTVTTESLTSEICPSLPSETPVLKLLPNTTIIIQEDNPDQGGIADVYRGSVGSVGQDADLIEKKGPMWLGDLLLKNQVPFKELSKVAFVLLPFENQLPSITATDGNSRLNANRMLRCRKVLSYIAERLESPSSLLDAGAMKPEEYLELYCNDHLIPPTMTLATLRTFYWKGGSDVMLYYKHNGKNPNLLHAALQQRLLDGISSAASGPGLRTGPGSVPGSVSVSVAVSAAASVSGSGTVTPAR